jgi:hypothetical protein
MVLKKQVVTDIKNRLAGDLRKVHMELNQNRYEINKLAERQSVLKKEIKEFYKMIRMFPKEV